MLKMFGVTLLGFFLFASGVYLAYFYLRGIDEGRSFLLLVPSFLLVVAGVYCFLLATKSGYVIGVRMDIFKPKEDGSQPKKSILERNNEISEEWTKTVEKRDKLKTLELSASAAEKSEAQ